MNEFFIVSLFLLGAVVVDALGDALRLLNKQIAHHTMEAVHLVIWVVIWAAFGFVPVYIAMYILGRVVAFDIVFNLAAGLPVFHVGNCSLYDRAITWFAGKVKQHPGQYSIVNAVLYHP